MDGTQRRQLGDALLALAHDIDEPETFAGYNPRPEMDVEEIANRPGHWLFYFDELPAPSPGTLAVVRALELRYKIGEISELLRSIPEDEDILAARELLTLIANEDCQIYMPGTFHLIDGDDDLAAEMIVRAVERMNQLAVVPLKKLAAKLLVRAGQTNLTKQSKPRPSKNAALVAFAEELIVTESYGTIAARWNAEHPSELHDAESVRKAIERAKKKPDKSGHVR